MHYQASKISNNTDDESIPDDCISNLTVDNIVFAIQEGKLKVLLVKYNRGIATSQWGFNWSLGS